MRLLYIANIRLPTEKAHGYQIMKMCESFAAKFEVELVVPWRFNYIKDDPFEYYGIERNFRIKKIFSLDLINVFGKAGFWLQSLSFSKLAQFRALFGRCDIIYSRDVLSLFWLSFYGKNIFWEVHANEYNFAVKRLLKKCAGIISISQGLKDFYVEKGADASKIMVAPDAVDLKKFEKIEADLRRLAKMRINADKNETREFLYADITYKIRGACFKIWKQFGGGFKEVIIERSLKQELINQGLEVETQKQIPVYYEDKKVGVYIPDMIVNDKVLIELKSKLFITKDDEKQFWLYLKGSEYKLGLLINFGPKKLEIKRRIYDKARTDVINQSESAYSEKENQRLSALIKEEAREKLSLPKDKILIGYVGMLKTMGMEKGIDVAIESLKYLPGAARSASLVLVGGRDEDIAFYKKYAARLNLENRVLFIGRVRHELIPVYLKAFDILIAPFPENEHYKFYMSPLKIFEYMASGRPIVASNLPALREVLNEESAVLVKAGDERALASSVEYILQNNEVSGRLAKKAYSDVEKYTWDGRARKITDFAVKILNLKN